MLPGMAVQMVEARPEAFYDSVPEWKGVRIFPGSAVYHIFATKYIRVGKTEWAPYVLLYETYTALELHKFPYPADWFRTVGLPITPLGFEVLETLDIPKDNGLGENIQQQTA